MRLISRFLQNQSRKIKKTTTKITKKTKRTKKKTIFRDSWKFSGNFPRVPKYCFVLVLLFFLVLFFLVLLVLFFLFFLVLVFWVFPGLASEDFEMDFPWVVLDSFH